VRLSGCRRFTGLFANRSSGPGPALSALSWFARASPALANLSGSGSRGEPDGWRAASAALTGQTPGRHAARNPVMTAERTVLGPVVPWACRRGSSTCSKRSKKGAAKPQKAAVKTSRATAVPIKPLLERSRILSRRRGAAEGNVAGNNAESASHERGRRRPRNVPGISPPISGFALRPQLEAALDGRGGEKPEAARRRAMTNQGAARNDGLTRSSVSFWCRTAGRRHRRGPG
jgi:hypothetical protein